METGGTGQSLQLNCNGMNAIVSNSNLAHMYCKSNFAHLKQNLIQRCIICRLYILQTSRQNRLPAKFLFARASLSQMLSLDCSPVLHNSEKQIPLTQSWFHMVESITSPERVWQQKLRSHNELHYLQTKLLFFAPSCDCHRDTISADLDAGDITS